LSRQLIHEYHTDLAQLKASTGSKRETNLRPAFGRLLRAWGKQHDLIFSEEYQRRTDKGNLISIDGALTVIVAKLKIPRPTICLGMHFQETIQQT
jgi:hypothetical protein